MTLFGSMERRQLSGSFGRIIIRFKIQNFSDGPAKISMFSHTKSPEQPIFNTPRQGRTHIDASMGGS